jgi:hypothetical protein
MRFAADENFDNTILRGLQRKIGNLDIVRVQDTEVYQADDPTVLAWAAKENRIMLSHDAKTLPDHAYKRVETGEVMPGVFIVDDQMAIGKAIEELALVIGASIAEEWQNLVVFIPMS